MAVFNVKPTNNKGNKIYRHVLDFTGEAEEPSTDYLVFESSSSEPVTLSTMCEVLTKNRFGLRAYYSDYHYEEVINSTSVYFEYNSHKPGEFDLKIRDGYITPETEFGSDVVTPI